MLAFARNLAVVIAAFLVAYPLAAVALNPGIAVDIGFVAATIASALDWHHQFTR